MQPEKIGRYEIRAELGRGGMATVYLAYDPNFDREVAVKILPHELLHDEQFRGRFDREAKIIARLEHAAIVPVHDVGEEDGQPFFVMRYMPGGSLSSRMNAGVIPIAETARIIQRVAAALDYAHSKGIVHRDLKPDNILFDEAGDPSISDFGIAKLAQSQTNLTAGRIVGTPTYMSPEQGQGDEVDGRSDIYSLGIILYEMLSGKPPYEANTPLGVLYKHVREPIPHILDVNRELPVTVEPVLEKAMAKKPTDRFSTAMDLANAMSAIARGETPDLDTTRPVPTHIHQAGAKPQVTPGGSKPTSSLRKVINWLAVLAAGVLVFLGGIRFMQALTATPIPTPNFAQSTLEITAVSAVPTVTATQTLRPTPTLTATPSPSPTVTVTSTATLAPGLGGADRIALITNNDIWTLDVDGSNAFQVLNDETDKMDLQWLPGGKQLIYLQGGCLYVVNANGQQQTKITCYGTPYLEGFQVSPDGKRAAIVIERRLLIVPFDLDALALTYARNDLENMKDSCLVYTAVVAKGVQWSADSRKVAILFQSAKSGKMADLIRVMDITRCHDADPGVLDEFPTNDFTADEYLGNPILPSYSWDGDQHFIFNTFKRNEGYGELYFYSMATNEYHQINPIDGVCCYRDARFSPDGKYILFAFQDLRLGENSKTQLYYIPFDQIGTGVKFTPLKLLRNFFSNPREKILPALRPPVP